MPLVGSVLVHKPSPFHLYYCILLNYEHHIVQNKDDIKKNNTYKDFFFTLAHMCVQYVCGSKIVDIT